MDKIPLIIFVDDDPKAGELMLRFSEDTSFGCRVFNDPEQALEFFLENGADLIISDLRMPKINGMELLARVRETNSDIPVIIITAFSTLDNAIEAIRLGATDFIKKPYDMEELILQVEKTLEGNRLRQENKMLKRQLVDEQKRFDMIGHSQPMQEVYAVIEKIADIRCNVIIEGESGTGKELVARAIHNMSQDANKPFIVIDCGALTDTLLESELFGYEKGAFTGASNTKQGLLEAASGGTLFLDEICNISDSMQTKLLRVVQEHQVTRVGGVKPIDINIRFVVATNRNLEEMVAQGRFRHDLYHRLNVVKIHMPPLRDHSDDIPLLARHFIKEISEAFKREIQGFDAESMKKLCKYEWPGNVRELRNLIERLIALSDSPVLHVDELQTRQPLETGTIDGDMPSIEELERRYIFKVLDKYNGNREKTATTLGINKSTLWRKLQQYNGVESSE